MKENIYTVSQINESTYKIDEMGRDISYLLLGDTKALLIDCSLGAGNIKKVVKEITNLPITVACTHGHADHTGAGYQFKKIYVHEDDCRFIFKISNSKFYKTTLLSNKMKKSGITFRSFKGVSLNCKWIPFKDGHSFDLGGRTVTALHTPGHSLGSCVFLDEKYKLMFTGDNTMPYLLMTVNPCVSLNAWLKGAEKTYELASTYTPLCSHGDGTQTKEQIGNTISLVKDILNYHKSNNDKKKITKHYSQDKSLCVVFNERKIY